MDYPAVAIIGPTASGKSAMGALLAKEFNGEIVSCDALQVYRWMDIGTAKPSREEREEVPHHLIDLRDPGEDFSAGDYQRTARAALRDIRARGRIPFVVGGTGLYLRALIRGLFAGPGRSEELRSRIRAIVQRKGLARLYLALRRVDPETCRRIQPRDASRIIRAYEVYLITGKPLSWWHRQPTEMLEGFRWLKLGICRPRAELYRGIEERVDRMFRAGFVEEVRGLLLSFNRQSHAFKALGYRQVLRFLEGDATLEEAKEETKRESRRYAKRQLTWFRAEGDVMWLDGTLEDDQLIAAARAEVRSFLG